LQGISLVLAVKAVRQRNDASSELPHLLDQFRRIVNVCVSTGIEQNVSSLKTLSSGCYHRLSREILGYYRLCASSQPLEYSTTIERLRETTLTPQCPMLEG